MPTATYNAGSNWLELAGFSGVTSARYTLVTGQTATNVEAPDTPITPGNYIWLRVGAISLGPNVVYGADIDPGVITFANFSVADITNIVVMDDTGIEYEITVTAPSGAVCFLGNAPVLTPAGYRRIDSLAAGDLVRTADGRDVAIQRVKHQRGVAPSAATNPYVIPAGKWGATENLPISPRHCVAVPGRGMVEARNLGLRQMPLRAPFDYYNLELPEWDNMVVAGVEVESLAPKKQVVVTMAQLVALAAGMPEVGRARLARQISLRGDGTMTLQLTKSARRM